ncbi:MAG: 50S ribosomal protein L1 [Candidatus Izimaplasma sp.]|nr:50S ribosomal protein L1 [Candidatus Izimaplasma bacterium]
MAKKSKKYLAAQERIGKEAHAFDEAVSLLKEVSFENFDASVEFAVRLNLDPRQAEQNLRGALVLPAGTGQDKTVLVFAKGDKAKEAEAAGADYVGGDEFVEKIQDGWTEFDTVVATPDMMSKVGRLGRILGPQGLMPNPKTGTVTMDIENAIKEIKAGKVEYRTDKAGNIHMLVGKVSFSEEDLKANIKLIYDTLVKLRPATVKGIYVQNVVITSTMGPAIKVDKDSILG